MEVIIFLVHSWSSWFRSTSNLIFTATKSVVTFQFLIQAMLDTWLNSLTSTYLYNGERFEPRNDNCCVFRLSRWEKSCKSQLKLYQRSGINPVYDYPKTPTIGPYSLHCISLCSVTRLANWARPYRNFQCTREKIILFLRSLLWKLNNGIEMYWWCDVMITFSFSCFSVLWFLIMIL